MQDVKINRMMTKKAALRATMGNVNKPQLKHEQEKDTYHSRIELFSDKEIYK